MLVCCSEVGEKFATVKILFACHFSRQPSPNKQEVEMRFYSHFYFGFSFTLKGFSLDNLLRQIIPFREHSVNEIRARFGFTRFYSGGGTWCPV